MNKYTNNASKGCVLEADLEYPKELCELHSDYLLVPDKIEIKRELLSNFHVKIPDFYNIPIADVKKFVSKIFVKEKYVPHYENLQLYLRLELKFKKVHRVLEFNQSQWLKPNVEFYTQERVEA